MPEQNINHSRRNPVLDTLRGIAIITIILHHLYLPARLPVNNLTGYVYSYFLKVIVLFYRGGWVAVDLFFVLSGFLVSGLLFNEYKKHSAIDIKNFLIRRSFKIYPAFVFFMVLTFLGETLLDSFSKNTYHPIDYLKDLFFLHNYLGGRWGQTWSLDVEEFFYLILPFLFYFLIKSKVFKFRSFASIYIFLLCFGIVCRFFVTLKYPGYHFEEQYTRTHFRLDGLFLGVLIAYIYNFKPNVLTPILNNKAAFSLLSILVISVNFFIARDYSWQAIILPAVNAMAFGVLLIICLNLNTLNNRFLSYTGKSSYSIYLWHSLPNYYSTYFMIWATDVYTANPSSFRLYGLSYREVYIIYFICYISSSILLGVLFTKIVEDPFLKIRNRLFRNKANNIITHVAVEESTFYKAVS